MPTSYLLNSPQTIMEAQYVIIEMLNQVRKKLVKQSIPCEYWLLTKQQYNKITNSSSQLYCKNFTFLYALSLALSCRQNYLEKNLIETLSVHSLLYEMKIQPTPTLFDEDKELSITLLNANGEQLPRGYLNIFLFDDFVHEMNGLVVAKSNENNKGTTIPLLLTMSNLVKGTYYADSHTEFIFTTHPTVQINNLTDCMVTENVVEKLSHYELELVGVTDVNEISYLIESFYYTVNLTDDIISVVPPKINKSIVSSSTKLVTDYLTSCRLIFNGMSSSNVISQ